MWGRWGASRRGVWGMLGMWGRLGGGSCNYSGTSGFG